MLFNPSSDSKESSNPISSPSSLQKNLGLPIFQILITQEREKRVTQECAEAFGHTSAKCDWRTFPHHSTFSSLEAL